MNRHFRLCASAYRNGAMIDATVYAGLPDRCHEGKIIRIALEDPDVLEIVIRFTRHAGVCEDPLVWTWESRCVAPYGGQQRVELIGEFEGQVFRMGASIPDTKPDYVACGFIVIARKVEHEPRLDCRTVLAGTEPPEGYEQVYPELEVEPVSQADCEAWRRGNCA